MNSAFVDALLKQHTNQKAFLSYPAFDAEFFLTNLFIK